MAPGSMLGSSLTLHPTARSSNARGAVLPIAITLPGEARVIAITSYGPRAPRRLDVWNREVDEERR